LQHQNNFIGLQGFNHELTYRHGTQVPGLRYLTLQISTWSFECKQSCIFIIVSKTTVKKSQLLVPVQSSKYSKHSALQQLGKGEWCMEIFLKKKHFGPISWKICKKFVKSSWLDRTLLLVLLLIWEPQWRSDKRTSPHTLMFSFFLHTSTTVSWNSKFFYKYYDFHVSRKYNFF
jgi:hypothetical protein